MIARTYDIRKSLPVVVYDCQAGWFSHRAAFMLKSFGHPNVRVLDGGFKKWTAEGGEVHQAPVASPADYDYSLSSGSVMGFEEVKQISVDKAHQHVDSRPASMHTAGAIPNAVNVDSGRMQNADGTMKSAEEIRQIYEAAGIDLSQPVVFSCNSGIKASVGYNAALHAGATGKMSLYDGSWSEWSTKK